MWGLTQLVWSVLHVARDFPQSLRYWGISICMMNEKSLHVKIVTQSITQELLWTYTGWANMAQYIHALIAIPFLICLYSITGIRNIVYSYVGLFIFSHLFGIYVIFFVWRPSWVCVLACLQHFLYTSFLIVAYFLCSGYDCGLAMMWLDFIYPFSSSAVVSVGY